MGENFDISCIRPHISLPRHQTWTTSYAVQRLWSLFGEDKTRATGVEVKQITKYNDLKNCFPKDKSGKDDFRIVSEEDNGTYKYTVFEKGMFSGLSSAGTCEFTTDNSDTRELTSITFKKGTSEIMLDGFTSLKEIIIE